MTSVTLSFVDEMQFVTVIQPVLPLHECADPAPVECAIEPLHFVTDPASSSAAMIEIFCLCVWVEVDSPNIKES
jgi:hypothetical protein